MNEYSQAWKIEELENEHLRVRVIPELGAKISQITDKQAQYDWLWTDESRPLRSRNNYDAYEAHDISGFDECFPNIGKGTYPGNPNIVMPDHGELWTKAWTCENSGNVITTTATGTVVPYKFQRKIELKEDSLLFSYSIENIGDTDFYGFWSAHPLFNAVEGMEIQVNGNPEMTKEFGFSSRLGADGLDGYFGHLDKYQWPHTIGADNQKYDISQVTLNKSLTDKVVLKSPRDGRVTLLNPQKNCSLSFNFDPSEIPFVGLCYNLDAWPSTGEKGRWLAIEPTHGCTDKLDEALKTAGVPLFRPEKPLEFAFSIIFNSFA